MIPMPYETFLGQKSQHGEQHGFAPLLVPDVLFDFQQTLLTWAIQKGRAAIFADCGLGKTPIALAWASNVVQHTGKRVLILTPLAVGPQFVEEGQKFALPCTQVRNGHLIGDICVTNYEQLHHLSPHDFAGVVADESSAIKHFEGERRKQVTEFLRTIPYRLLSTATAAPNDYTELGTSSEAVGELGYHDMLSRFFTTKNRTISAIRKQWRVNKAPQEEDKGWRFKGHADVPFWQWVSSWARACRKPSDLGGNDTAFVLPPLHEVLHVVKARQKADGMLLELPAVGLHEEREELKRTLQERCEQVAALTQDSKPWVCWCNLNPEADLLERLIPDAKQVSGTQSAEEKEAIFHAFRRGNLRVLITKPKIGAWGLNWTHCHQMTFFASHSYEQYYQAQRRCWRFGQQHPVTVHLITTEGQANVLANVQRKAQQADAMFTALLTHMRQGQTIARTSHGATTITPPSWLKGI
ncbi:MAG TPA: DEAD/DEAH box helicase [Nitrospiraceae bacterium]